MSEKDRISEKLVSEAVSALLKIHSASSNQKPSLLGEFSSPVLAVIQIKPEKSHQQKAVVKPIRVKIPNSLFSSSPDSSICLFCRSEDKQTLVSLQLPSSIEGLAVILSLDDVKKQFKDFKDKKKLISSYSNFLCDARITIQLYSLLGKVFSNSSNRMPVPIDIPIKNVTTETIRKQVDKLVNHSTFMHLPKSTSLSASPSSNICIRFGHTSMERHLMVENLMVGISTAVSKLSNQWRAIHSIHLKLENSPALPIYSFIANDPVIQSLLLKKDPSPKEGDSLLQKKRPLDPSPKEGDSLLQKKRPLDPSPKEGEVDKKKKKKKVVA